MSRFEDELRLALRREEPSPDFTDRLLARIAALPAEMQPEKSRERAAWRRRLAGFFQLPALSWAPMNWAAAGALAVLLLAVGIGVYHHREQRRLAEIAEGEKAKEQVLLAMRIASAKLNVAQKKVQQTLEHSQETK